MILHSDWGWGKITDIVQDQIFLRFSGGFGAWFDRAEFTARMPRKMPRSKSETVIFQHMGYAVPEFD